MHSLERDKESLYNINYKSYMFPKINFFFQPVRLCTVDV